jgi:hypothetical protein
MSNKIWCTICGRDIPYNSVEQHNAGKKHRYYLEIFEKTGEHRAKPVKNHFIKTENIENIKTESIDFEKEFPLYAEINSIFPQKLNPMLNIKHYSKKTVEKVLFLIYTVLFDFNEEMEFEETEMNYMKDFLRVKHILKADDLFMLDNLKNNHREKFIFLFISSIKSEIILPIEIRKIYDYDALNNLLEEDNIDEAQIRIQNNYRSDIESYISIYSEAKKEFEKTVLQEKF